MKRLDHKNDGAFRAIVKAATTKFTNLVDFETIVEALLDSGYHVTVEDTEGRRNGTKNVTSVLRHRIYEQLKLLGPSGEIARVKIGAAKRGKYLYGALGGTASPTN